MHRARDLLFVFFCLFALLLSCASEEMLLLAHSPTPVAQGKTLRLFGQNLGCDSPEGCRVELNAAPVHVLQWGEDEIAVEVPMSAGLGLNQVQVVNGHKSATRWVEVSSAGEGLLRECFPGACHGHGACFEVPGGPTQCLCEAGYEGPRCGRCQEGLVKEAGLCLMPSGEGTCAQPTEIALDASLSFVLSPAPSALSPTCVGGSTQEAVFLLTLERETHLDIEVQGLSPVLSIRSDCDDYTSEILCEPMEGRHWSKSMTLEAGEHYLIVDTRNLSQEEEYLLRLTPTCPDDMAWDRAQHTCTQDPCETFQCEEANQERCVPWAGAPRCLCDAGFVEREGRCVDPTLNCEHAITLSESEDEVYVLLHGEGSSMGSCGGAGSDRPFRFEVLETTYFWAELRRIEQGVLYLRRDCESPGTELSCDDEERYNANLSLELAPGHYTLWADSEEIRAPIEVELRYQLSRCGSGVKSPEETCDDGNLIDGDGCSASCEVEFGFVCETPADRSLCVPYPHLGTFGVGDKIKVSGDHIERGDARCFSLELLEEVLTIGLLESESGDPALWWGIEERDYLWQNRYGAESWDDEIVDEGASLICIFARTDLEHFSLEIDLLSSPLCGDLRLDEAFGEQCDDGNEFGGDGCSAGCEIELGYSCDTSISPSLCHPFPDLGAFGPGDTLQVEEPLLSSGESRCYRLSATEDLLTIGLVEATKGSAILYWRDWYGEAFQSSSDERDWDDEIVNAGEMELCIQASSEHDLEEFLLQVVFQPTPSCGDGYVAYAFDETCDDGDIQEGDGCSSSCQVEFGYGCDCSEVPSRCTRYPFIGRFGVGDQILLGDGTQTLVSGKKQCVLLETEEDALSIGSFTRASGELQVFWHHEQGKVFSDDSEGRVLWWDDEIIPKGQQQLCIQSYSSDAVDYQLSILLEPSPCGNGVLEPQYGELCDDGNSGSDDGCSSRCVLEVGFNCDTSEAPTLCEPYPYLGEFGVGEAIRVGEGSASINEGLIHCYSLALREEVLTEGIISAEEGSFLFQWSGESGLLFQKTGQGERTWNDEIISAGAHQICVEPGGSQALRDYDIIIALQPQPSCGDGVVAFGFDEACDDGNLSNEDGCSEQCEIELGFNCDTSEAPTLCEPYPHLGDFGIGDQITRSPEETLPIDNEHGFTMRLLEEAWTWGELGAIEGDPALSWSNDDGAVLSLSAWGPETWYQSMDPGFYQICVVAVDADLRGWSLMVQFEPPPACGDGHITEWSGERCDDGNLIEGDGCSDECQLELGFICVDDNGASSCTPCPSLGLFHRGDTIRVGGGLETLPSKEERCYWIALDEAMRCSGSLISSSGDPDFHWWTGGVKTISQVEVGDEHWINEPVEAGDHLICIVAYGDNDATHYDLIIELSAP